MNTHAAIHIPHIHIFLKRERRIVGWWDTWEGREGSSLRKAEFRKKWKSRLLLEIGRLEVDMGHALACEQIITQTELRTVSRGFGSSSVAKRPAMNV